VFAHLPLLVNERRQKLSKRRDDVAVEEYRERGYLPDAMRNYLALLGWSPGKDREIVPVHEMIAAFRLEDVNPSPAFFDVQKLDHINAEYIRALPVEVFVRESLPWLESSAPWPPERFELGAFERMAAPVQERVRTLAEVPGMVDFLFLEEPLRDPDAWERVIVRSAVAGPLLDDAVAAYADCEWEVEVLHGVTQAVGERHGLKLSKAQAPIRVAVTGRTVGPPLFEALEVLGRQPVLARLRAARAEAGAVTSGAAGTQ
jgi:glutamyl-tRNA synthetase